MYIDICFSEDLTDIFILNEILKNLVFVYFRIDSPDGSVCELSTQKATLSRQLCRWHHYYTDSGRV